MSFSSTVLQIELMPMWIWTILTHVTATRGMRAKYVYRLYKQPYVAQSEVTLPALSSPVYKASSFPTEHYCRHHRVARLRSPGSLASLQQSSCAHESVTRDNTALPLQLTCIHCSYDVITSLTQINLSCQLWILFLTLLVSISPNSCSGGE